jgi:hypothetical protein
VDLPSETVQFLKTESNGLVPYTLELDYDYWTAGTELNNLVNHLLKAIQMILSRLFFLRLYGNGLQSVSPSRATLVCSVVQKFSNC